MTSLNLPPRPAEKPYVLALKTARGIRYYSGYDLIRDCPVFSDDLLDALWFDKCPQFDRNRSAWAQYFNNGSLTFESLSNSRKHEATLPLAHRSSTLPALACVCVALLSLPFAADLMDWGVHRGESVAYSLSKTALSGRDQLGATGNVAVVHPVPRHVKF